jgi:hypothetical protein
MHNGRHPDPLSRFVKREVMPGNLKSAALENFIRDAASSYWHQTCTAKMGHDAMSVVDERRRRLPCQFGERVQIPGPHLVYGFQTTAPNAVVEPIHPKAMPVTHPKLRGMGRSLSRPHGAVDPFQG